MLLDRSNLRSSHFIAQSSHSLRPPPQYSLGLLLGCFRCQARERLTPKKVGFRNFLIDLISVSTPSISICAYARSSACSVKRRSKNFMGRFRSGVLLDRSNLRSNNFIAQSSHSLRPPSQYSLGLLLGCFRCQPRERLTQKKYVFAISSSI